MLTIIDRLLCMLRVIQVEYIGVQQGEGRYARRKPCHGT